jgi:enoyl-CoA hydratase
LIRLSVEGALGRITLDRPDKLNALSLEMIRAMRRALADWEVDEGVRTVAVDSAHPRAFCAGGDIVAIWEMAVVGRFDEIDAFFGQEYGLDLAVARFPKPFVALVDGFSFGGGLGISVNGRWRVVTEHAEMAMPETAIGFFPDVGASHFLPRLRGHAGMYLGLSGARVHGADAVHLGLATHFVRRRDLAALREALRVEEAGAALRRFAADLPPPSLDLAELDACFGEDSLAAVRECLRAREAAPAEQASPSPRAVLERLGRMSPSAMLATFRLLRHGKATLEACLAEEQRLGREMVRSHDFREGVRAMLVDKDRAPRWAPVDY